MLNDELSMFETSVPELTSLVQNALNQLSNSPLLTALESLSGIPVHPYDRLKYSLYGDDFKFKTLDDIPAPVNFVPLDNLQAVIEKSKQINEALLPLLNNSQGDDTTLFDQLTGSALLDNEKQKNHIEFVEMIRQMPTDISDDKLTDYAKKILEQYLNLNF